jgi:hypothetical protein
MAESHLPAQAMAKVTEAFASHAAKNADEEKRLLALGEELSTRWLHSPPAEVPAGQHPHPGCGCQH